MSHEKDTRDDAFARMASALPATPARRRSGHAFADTVRTPPPVMDGAPVRPKRKGRVARSEPLPSIAMAGETRPQQATESGPALPSVMVAKPVPSPTTRRQIAAPTVRRSRPPMQMTMTTGKKSAVLAFLAFSIAVFALGVAAFFYARSPAPRVNAAAQPPPDARVSMLLRP